VQAPELYNIFEDQSRPLVEIGFKKRAKNLYTKEGMELQIIPGSHGWTPEYGWDFLVRLTDTKTPTNGHPYQPSLDIRASGLIEIGALSQAALDEAYEDTIREHPTLTDGLDLGRFGFYSSADLKRLLILLMPAIAQRATEWELERIEERKKPRPEFRKRTPEEIEAIKADAERQLRSAGLNPQSPPEN
jgi:hypothetical protein